MFTCTDAGLLDTSTDGRTIITAADFWELFLTKALQHPDPRVPTYLKRPQFKSNRGFVSWMFTQQVV